MLPKYKRILLKLSGESLMGDKSFGFDTDVLGLYAQDIQSIIELGVQVAIVIGGGNIYRGMNEAETGIERAHGDYLGKNWGVHPFAKRNKNGADSRTLYSPAGYTSPGKRAGSDIRGWYRQSVFYY
jgi:hypothetical protein